MTLAKKIISMHEGQHYNTKVRSIDEKMGSRKIRLGVNESKKMIENMLNPKHKSPNPKSGKDKKLLEDCKMLLEQAIPRLKECKDSKRVSEDLEPDAKKEFIQYVYDAYGPNGILSSSIKKFKNKPVDKREVQRAVAVLLNSEDDKLNVVGDSVDRGRVRDILLYWRGEKKLENDVRKYKGL